MKKLLKINYLALLILLLIFCMVPLFIKTPYILSIFITTFLAISSALAWSILGGLTGLISLGHAAFFGLGAYISTMLLNFYNVSPWISIILVFFIVGTIGTIILSPCLILHGAYFSLVTIAFGEAIRNLFLNWDLAGKGQGLLLDFGKGSFYLMRFSSKIPYFYIVLILMFSFYGILKMIDNSKLGYGLKTIREDEDTANAIGINPQKYKMIATFISCGLIAICGVIYANYVRYINPDIMMATKSIEFVLPAIIGGLGSVTGPLIGGLLLIPLSEYLNAALGNIVSGLNLVVYSTIIIIVILYQPSGIMGWFNKSKIKKKLLNTFQTQESKQNKEN
jgi:branched-chain amino acid transport system permease protein